MTLCNMQLYIYATTFIGVVFIFLKSRNKRTPLVRSMKKQSIQTSNWIPVQRLTKMMRKDRITTRQIVISSKFMRVKFFVIETLRKLVTAGKKWATYFKYTLNTSISGYR